ncbi:MAG: hypothetical protein HYU98_03725 [Deltaproteobacteria bacterium]|nr:hypothetical protein [Deltaproteobacteria bacterium]
MTIQYKRFIAMSVFILLMAVASCGGNSGSGSLGGANPDSSSAGVSNSSGGEEDGSVSSSDSSLEGVEEGIGGSNPAIQPLIIVTKVGSGTISGGPDGVDNGVDYRESVDLGTIISLTALPDAGWAFDSWSGDCVGLNNPFPILMDADKNCEAKFVLATYVLTVDKTGTGTVTSDPAGIDCGAACAQGFTSGASVTLAAIAGLGFAFTDWSGACAGMANPAVVSMDADKACTANFSVAEQSLTVNKVGSGTVTSDPVGINCGAVCNQGFSNGSFVDLLATPDVDWAFTSWSGDCAGSASPISIMIDANKACNATFTPTVQYTLNVSKTGNGVLTTNPAGINCGVTCSTLFNPGVHIQLAATADPGWGLDSWSGDCTGVLNPAVLVMSTNRNCAATFSIKPWARSFNASALDSGRMIEQTPDGGFIILGGLDSSGSGMGDFWVIKTDEVGAPVWQYSYGGEDLDVARSIAKTPDGGYIVSGHSYSFTPQNAYDFWVLKLNQDGTIGWQFVYDDGLSSDNVNATVQPAYDGSGYFVIGNNYSQMSEADVFVLKLDNNGNVIWQNTYGTSGLYDYAYDSSATPDGGVVFSASALNEMAPNGYYDMKMWIVKLNGNGTIGWQKAYSLGANIVSTFIRKVSSGYIAGATYASIDGEQDVLILKLDSVGGILWQNSYGEIGFGDTISSIIQTSDGRYVMTGSTVDYNGLDFLSAIWTVKLNTNGNIIWQKMYRHPTLNLESFYASETPSSNLAIIGDITDFSMSSDLLVLRVSSNGLITFNPATGASVVDSSVVPVGTAIANGVSTLATPVSVVGVSEITTAVGVATSAAITVLAP